MRRYGPALKNTDSAINVLLDVVQDQSGKQYKMDHYATRYPTNVIDIASFLVRLFDLSGTSLLGIRLSILMPVFIFVPRFEEGFAPNHPLLCCGTLYKMYCFASLSMLLRPLTWLQTRYASSCHISYHCPTSTSFQTQKDPRVEV